MQEFPNTTLFDTNLSLLTPKLSAQGNGQHISFLKIYIILLITRMCTHSAVKLFKYKTKMHMNTINNKESKYNNYIYILNIN